jgi:hypothetical protein
MTPKRQASTAMCSRPLKALIAALWILAALPAASADPAPTPHVYALVSAVGSKISYVRMKMGTGSNNLDPYKRIDVDVPGAAIDGAVLRGLERVILQDDPGAQMIYMKLNPKELEGSYAYKHGDVAIGKLASALEKMPGRKDWYRIVVVTPRYVNSERAGLGTKLHGIGIYVRPFGSGLATDAFDDQANQPDTISPEGVEGRSKRYIAPFFYTQVWVIDPATLQVLESNERYDFQRYYDPKSTANDIEDAIPPEKLGPLMEKFVEQSSARSLREAIGSVTVREKPLEAAPLR